MPPAKPQYSAKNTKSHSNPSFFQQSTPLYIGLLLLVLGLVVGFGLRAAFFEAPLPTNPDTNTTPTLQPLEVQVFLPANCTNCVEKTVLERILDKRGVLYERKLQNTTDATVQAQLKSWNITTLPVTAVNTLELQRRDPPLFNSIGPYGQNNNGTFFIEEKNIYPDTLLPGSQIILQHLQNPVPSSCSMNTKPVVWEFGDPLCKDCFASHGQVDQLLLTFGNQIQYEYKSFLQSGQDQDDENAANAIECARDQNQLQAYKNEMGQKWYEQGAPIWSTVTQLQIAKDLNMTDLNRFQSCINNGTHRSVVDRNNGIDATLARAFGITRQPAFALDCQYTVMNTQSISQILCDVHPQLVGCKTN
ncbi:MAG: thioredoxin domain-containing protein [Candidatus Diapherotrites archaeon]|nr:thioredoxin domain-containing protein [Candidatus Diapherotrites archaeon]